MDSGRLVKVESVPFSRAGDAIFSSVRDACRNDGGVRREINTGGGGGS